MAKTEMADLVNAINAYEADYGRYPIPTNIETSALARHEDLTYGGPLLDAALGPGASTPLNADMIAILMNLTKSPDGSPTINVNQRLNPKQIKFLNAKFSGNNTDRGVGNDMVYRDPWGHPYIITMDLSGNGWCRDPFYQNHLVSRENESSGFFGLTNNSDTNGISDAFELHGKVMVWSFGPDGKADVTQPANAAPNQDNILSWQ
jgi:hypothetical protein